MVETPSYVHRAPVLFSRLGERIARYQVVDTLVPSSEGADTCVCRFILGSAAAFRVKVQKFLWVPGHQPALPTRTKQERRAGWPLQQRRRVRPRGSFDWIQLCSPLGVAYSGRNHGGPRSRPLRVLVPWNRGAAEERVVQAGTAPRRGHGAMPGFRR